MKINRSMRRNIETWKRANRRRWEDEKMRKGEGEWGKTSQGVSLSILKELKVISETSVSQWPVANRQQLSI
jgi:hypothetical protein